VDYRFYLGRKKDDHCNLIPGNHFHYATQYCNIKAFGNIYKTLTWARESESILKFRGKLETTCAMEIELDNE